MNQRVHKSLEETLPVSYKARVAFANEMNSAVILARVLFIDIIKS